MDKSHPLSTPMVVRSLEVDKNPFRPKKYTKDILGLITTQIVLFYTLINTSFGHFLCTNQPN